ncbi:hypothetical protein ASG90_05325 [Nocardioides sp. Soil797]|nr:hypothetical protein ASG90_05325 [Nocardioides sp. Soil797]
MASRTNEHGQQIGPTIDGWAPCPFPDVATLRGSWCRVEPLLAEHSTELYDELCGPGNEDLWTYLPVEMPADRAEFAELIEARADLIDAVAVLIRTADGTAAGTATLMRVDRANGSVEVGWIVLGRSLQRTTAATEAQYLLAKHAFDLGYRRYEWKCDALNEPSRRAAARLGFVPEGRFRQALVYKGRNRDTDWFSITDAEWPTLAAAFQQWLDPDNQPDGRQVRSLGDVRGDR